MAFCPHCGKEVSPDAFACPACGHPLKQFQPAVRPSEPVSGVWWLLPLFLAWIGGLIAYFVLKDRNQTTAEHMLIFGVVWTFVGAVVIWILFFVLFFATAISFSHFTSRVALAPLQQTLSLCAWITSNSTS
jgi:uncharacterized membrane protein YeaQ/YmgE (transglycosylase-associated protein family)